MAFGVNLGPPKIDFDQLGKIGDSFSEAYKAARKDALTADLGEKIKVGDYAGAADAALKAGDLTTGLSLVKLGEGRAASKQLAEGFGGLYGGDAPSAAPSAPAFSGGAARMRAPGGGGEIESRFIDTLKAGGLTNPHGLAAMAAYANHESGYSPGNITGSWSDPSESGQPGTSGGILSWRGDRFANMQRATAGAADPVAAQARFALTENPSLTQALQNAGSPEEANRLMADAWRFAGYNRPGGELAARLGTTQQYLGRLGGGAPAATTRGASAPVDVAENEGQVRALEQRMGMLPRAVAGVDPDAASKPAPDAQSAEFRIPAAGSAAPQAVDGMNPGTPGQPAPRAQVPVIPEPLSTTGTLARAGVPLQTAAAVGRAAPGSPDRIRKLIQMSLIPGLSEAQAGVVKTLLANEMEQGKLTSDQREYAMAQAQGFQGTFVDYKNALSGRDKTPDGVAKLNDALANWQRYRLPDPQSQAPADQAYWRDFSAKVLGGQSGTTVNVDTKGETEEAKALGKARGERGAAIETAAMKAPDQIGKLDLLSRVLDGATTGTLGPTESTVVGLAQSLGIPNETIARLGLNPQQAVNAQVATKLINESVVGMIGAGGFPANNFSNTDREFLTDIFPKISNRPEANRLAIQVLRRVQQRNLEMGDAWAEYQQAQQEAGRPARLAEFEFNFRKGLRGKPGVFDDLRAEADALRQGDGGKPNGGAGTDGPAKFDPAVTKISMEDGKGLKNADDTPENRQIFDARYGEGAAKHVLGRPLAGTSEPAAGTKPALPKGKDRIPIPGGASSGAAVAEARAALRARPDQRAAIVEKLRGWGIDPARLDAPGSDDRPAEPLNVQ